MCESQGVSEQVLAMKEGMQQTLNHIGPDNADSCFALLTSQFEVIQRLYTIEKMKAALGVPRETATDSLTVDEPNISDLCVTGIDPIDSTSNTDASQDASLSESERTMYRVERKLKGGFIAEIEGYVPETVLRQQAIEHGDYVFAEPIPALKFGQNRFRYELAKKSDVSEVPGRIEYTCCPVIKDGQLLVVTHSSVTGARIKSNESPYSIVLNDRDIGQFDLSEGDVVDVAFYDSNPSAAAVVWKHDVFDESSLVKPAQKKSVYRKDDEAVECEAEVEQVFAGQTVCVVGDMPSESIYKSMIEERGGKHLHVEPKWGVTRIQTHVKKSDVVVGLYDVSSHTGLEKTKEYCKRYNIPFKMISGKGKTKVIQTAVELLGVPV